jgi:hypothetical protein
MSMRGIKRTFGVGHQTLMRWVWGKIRFLPAFEDTLLPSEKGDVSPNARTVSVAKRKARPTTPNASLARCTHAWAGWCAEPIPFPRAWSVTSTRSIASAYP